MKQLSPIKSVEDLFNRYNYPHTAEEISRKMWNVKSKGSVFKEITKLVNADVLGRVEVNVQNVKRVFYYRK